VQGGPEEEEDSAKLWLADEMWSAMKAGVAGWHVAWFMAMDPRMVAEWFLVGLVWVRLPTKADESCAPAISGAVDGGTHVCRSIVEGIDVVALTCLSDMLQGKPHIRSQDRTMAALLGVVFPLEDVVLELDPFRGYRGLRGCAAAAGGGVPFTCKERQMSPLIFACGVKEAHVLLSWHVVSL
jgi:hypothetical protein